PIGHATEDIAVGDHVHTHNVATNLSDNLTYTYTPGDLSFPVADKGRTNIDGFYAIGDCAYGSMRQVVSACYEGALVAEDIVDGGQSRS
ncbi:MAG: hypothetical protein IKB20_06110, partial [Clostridia bacterium]|nr:hypothetical protein [Clostridia bacterium]